MSRLSRYVLVCGLLLVLGCQSKSAELAERSVDLLEGGLLLLEQHQETPDLAPPLFAEYIQNKQDEITALAELAGTIKSEKSDPEQATIRRHFLERLKPLNSRLRAIATIYASKPEIMAALKKIHPPTAP